MSFWNRLFGKKDSASERQPNSNEGASDTHEALALQRAYWTFNADELAALQTSPRTALSWPDRLRLHHLLCLQRVAGEANDDALRASVQDLAAHESPYRPRVAFVWQGSSAPASNSRDADHTGEFLNPSLTHLGCVEVLRVDADFRPQRLDFVGFDDLSGIMFATSQLWRAAKLFYHDHRDEMVLLPALYGLTWEHGNEYDRDGRMTRFIDHVSDTSVAPVGASGLGIGQQDLTVIKQDGSATLFGITSVAEIIFPLDVREHRFDEKARARGLDPDQVRQQTRDA